jgi:cobalt/nickel transport system permease protein
LRFAAVDEWSLRDSVLHRRDPRAKIVASLLLLVAIGRGSLFPPAALLAAGVALAQLPAGPLLMRAAVVLPFALTFALGGIFAGRAEAALYLVLRSYISAICVLLLMGTTPLPALLEGLRRMGAPPLLLEVIQFVHRYLYLIAEQAKRMAIAATARGARRTFTAVAGSVGVLFARSYDRAEAIHRAMLARGYTGSMPARAPLQFTAADAALITVALLGAVAAMV